jgi:hypothetical protein
MTINVVAERIALQDAFKAANENSAPGNLAA